MAILRLKEIQAMSSEDRTKKLAELRTELSHIKTMINAGGAIENPARGRELRKTVAQILTTQNEDKLGIRKPAKEPAEKAKKKTEPVEKKLNVKKETEETVSK